MNLKVSTAKETINSLFKAGGTTDVIIRQHTKNTVKITYQGQNYTINKWGVLCFETITQEGIRYSYCPFNIPKKEIIDAVLQWKGIHEIQRYRD